MPEIDRDAISAKLDTIPEADREPYLQALKAKGYTWKSNASSAPVPTEPGVQPVNPFEIMSKGARLAGAGLEKVGDTIAEKLGGAGAPAAVAAGAGAVPGIAGKILDIAGEAVPQSPRDFLTLLAFEGAGRGMGAAGEALFPALETRAPNVVRAVKAAMSADILPSMTQTTQSKFLANAEEIASKVPVIGRRILSERAKQDAAYDALRSQTLDAAGRDLANPDLGERTRTAVSAHLDQTLAAREKALGAEHQKLMKKFGPGQEVDAIGRQADEVRAARTQLEKREARKLYDAVDDAIPDSLNKVEDAPLRAAARVIHEENKGLPGAAYAENVPGLVKDLMNGPAGKVVEEATDPIQSVRVAGLEPGVDQDEARQAASDALTNRKTYTFKEMSTLRSSITGMIEQEKAKVAPGQMTPKGRYLVQLKDAVDETIGKFSEGLPKDVKALKEVADANYKSYKGTYANAAMKSLGTVAREHPEQVYGMFVRPNNASDIARLKTVVGKDGFAPFQQKFVSDLVTGKDGAILGQADVVKNLARYGHETLREMLSPAQMREVGQYAAKRQLPQFLESEMEKKLRDLIVQSRDIGRAPEQIVSKVIDGDTAVTKALANVMGPEGMAPYKRKVVENIIGAPAKADTMTGVRPPPSALKVSRNLEAYEPAFLKHLGFSEGELADIRKVDDAKALLESQQKLMGNPSGTSSSAYATALGVGAGTLFFHNPLAGTLSILSGELLSRFYTSPEGRRLLIDGMNPSFASDAKFAARFSGFLSNAALDHEEEGGDSGMTTIRTSASPASPPPKPLATATANQDLKTRLGLSGVSDRAQKILGY